MNMVFILPLFHILKRETSDILTFDRLSLVTRTLIVPQLHTVSIDDVV